MTYGHLSWRRKRYFPLLSFLAGLALLAILAFIVWVGWGVREFFSIRDLSTHPPEDTFKWVFGIPPPAGIKNLQVAGIAGGLSGNAWMRFDVENVEQALTVFKQSSRFSFSEPTRQPKPVTKEELPGLLLAEYTQQYERAVAWESVYHIKRPEYYTFPTNFGGSGWAGVMVVDRQRKRMFAYATLF